jgi:heme A synthase
LIKSFVVILIPHQLSLDLVVERRQDHIRLLYDLPNGMTLAHKIVASLVFLVIEILAIKDNKLNSTFLYVAFRLQSLFKPTSDQTSSDTN